MSPQQISPKNAKIQDFKNISICPYCDSKRSKKRGFRKTQNRGKIQRYECLDCNKRYVKRDGFFRMKNDSNKITMCLDMYYKGISLRKIQYHLGVFLPHNSSHMTILRWIRKYSKMVGDYTDTLKISNSGSITFDEMEYKTKKKKSFFIGVMDMETRYLLSSGYYYDRGLPEFTEVLTSVKDKSLTSNNKFFTDGLGIYPTALRKVFNYKKHATKKFKHKVTKSSDKAFNWKIERFNNSLRERTKIMRQFNSLESAKSIIKGYEIYYNFCRYHQGIKAYPYERATNLKLGKNKWLDLIQLSAKAQ